MTGNRTTADGLAAAVGSLGPPQPQVPLLLPKFSFRTHLGLVPILEGLGMTDVFDPDKADLSGTDGAHDLHVGAVVHEAMVEVDEQGTVAAAATAGSEVASAEPTPIAVDHPFLFLIRDTANGSILFTGHVEDPRQGS